MGFEGKSMSPSPAPAERNEGETSVDVQEVARKLEIYSDTDLTPPSMGREMLLQQRELILKVEDPGERSVLEGKYDKAALKLWAKIIPNNQDSRPLGAALNDDGQSTQYERNIADIKDFPFFDIETRTEAVKLAELKQEGWGDYIREHRRLDAREGF